MNASELESIVGEELRRLPIPPAPHTLLPRVMTAVERWTTRPWYRRAWLTWPVTWQAASLAIWMAVIGGLVLLWPGIQQTANGAASDLLAGASARAVVYLNDVRATMAAMRIVWRTLVEPVAPFLLGVVAVASLACTLFGAALNSLVLGRMVHR